MISPACEGGLTAPLFTAGIDGGGAAASTSRGGASSPWIGAACS